jgi:hypothetical protein
MAGERRPANAEWSTAENASGAGFDPAPEESVRGLAYRRAIFTSATVPMNGKAMM